MADEVEAKENTREEEQRPPKQKGKVCERVMVEDGMIHRLMVAGSVS
jgi:hypothetical protein